MSLGHLFFIPAEATLEDAILDIERALALQELVQPLGQSWHFVPREHVGSGLYRSPTLGGRKELITVSIMCVA